MAKWPTAENCDQYPIHDPVNKPDHYNNGTIECIDYIKDCMTLEEYRGYLRGNVIKYQHRHTYKGKPQEDLAKAAWYLSKLQETYSQ